LTTEEKCGLWKCVIGCDVQAVGYGETEYEAIKDALAKTATELMR
jgi:hypothetical protein